MSKVSLDEYLDKIKLAQAAYDKCLEDSKSFLIKHIMEEINTLKLRLDKVKLAENRMCIIGEIIGREKDLELIKSLKTNE
jgi:hypothetical protein